MKTTGLVRNLDEMGRLVLPKELRRKLGLQEREPVEFFIDGQQIVIKKHQKTCVFCGADDNLLQFKEKTVCESCVGDLHLIKTISDKK